MTADFSALVSKPVKNAPPVYFPPPPDWIKYNFDQGTPAPEIYPLEDLRRYAAAVLDKFGADALGYYAGNHYDEMSYGYAGLRAQIAARIERRDGKTLGVDGVMLVNGSAQGIALVAHAFLDAGDGVVVEASSFPYAVGYFRAAGATVMTAPVDADGMDIDAVEARLREMRSRGIRPKLIYTIPTFQVPTGTTLPLERRLRLLALAKAWNVLILEDNCYYELRYDGENLPTLFSLDDSGLVLQSDSFSKMLAPGLRMAWLAGAPEAMRAVATVREDLGVSQWTARMLEAYLADGRLDPHLDRVRVLYRRKRDVALRALREHCAGLVSFEIPAGGIYFWLRLADDVDAEQVRLRMIDEGVACRPGERFMDDDSAAQFLRVAFLQVPEQEVERGIAALGRALAAARKA